MSEYCVSTPIVYDWITIEEEIKKYKYVPTKYNVKQMEDCVCINFNVRCQNDLPTPVWETVGDKIDAATLSIYHEGTCSCDWLILANHEEIATVAPTNTITATVGNIENISILCVNGCSDEIRCEGTLDIVVHYLISTEIQSEKHSKKVSCFLSDKHGTPANLREKYPLKCRETGSSRSRKSKYFLASDGEDLILEEVSILIEGYISVKITDLCDDSFVICTFPISMVKTFFLCAPNGTNIVCDIDNICCNAVVVDDKHYKNCMKVLLDLEFCLNVQSLYKTVINVKGNLCEPRADVTSMLKRND